MTTIDQESREIASYRELKADLGSFVGTFTEGGVLQNWQWVFCKRLQEILGRPGRDIVAVSAPPQVGKSLILTKRLPLWLNRTKPKARVIIAASNITNARNLALPNRLVAESDQFRNIFGQTYVEWTDDRGAYTPQRKQINDGQPSLKWVGLESGLVGTGFDVLLIDDPYASASDAYSEAYANSLETFWHENVMVRFYNSENTKIVFMFHRYHDDDFIGRRLRDTPGLINLRFAAELDGLPDEAYPVRFDDDTGEPTIYLTKRQPPEAIEAKKLNEPYVYAGQFQGIPDSRQGRVFPVNKVVYQDSDKMPKLARRVRTWDCAASVKASADFTSSALTGFDSEQYFYVFDVTNDRVELASVAEHIVAQALKDGPSVVIAIEAASSGNNAIDALARDRRLRGYTVVKIPTRGGDKRQRAEPLASRMAAGCVIFQKAGWNPMAANQLQSFTGYDTGGKHDDMVDALSHGYNYVSTSVVNFEERSTIRDVGFEYEPRYKD
jgi:predicted phage terminase large subunit-like protein